MASITLKGVPDSLKERLEKGADRNRRSLSQQALLLLQRSLAEEPGGFQDGFHKACRRFRDEHGPSPLRRGDWEGLRSGRQGREANL